MLTWATGEGMSPTAAKSWCKRFTAAGAKTGSKDVHSAVLTFNRQVRDRGLLQAHSVVARSKHVIGDHTAPV
jgi:hypothetical protein